MVTTKTRKTFGNQALHALIEPRPYKEEEEECKKWETPSKKGRVDRYEFGLKGL